MSSFAVQLVADERDRIVTFMPGIIEVYCVDVDWGHLADGLDSELHLERRLCWLGTPGMFCLNNGAKHIHHGEGVSVALGSYDPVRRAFVQCSLKVDAIKPEACRQDELGVNEIRFTDSLTEPSHELSAQGSAVVPAKQPVKKRRRAFRPCSFI